MFPVLKFCASAVLLLMLLTPGILAEEQSPAPAGQEATTTVPGGSPPAVAPVMAPAKAPTTTQQVRADLLKPKPPAAGERGGPASTSAEPWLERSLRLPRLAASLIRENLQPRPISVDYHLVPGDRVRLVTWGGVQINQQVPVDAAGTLAIPGVGAIPVAGMTVADAQTRLGELLRAQFRNAGIIIAVDQAAGAGIVVTGEVAAPGWVTVAAGGTLLDALSAAGGVLDEGTLRAIQVRAPGAEPVTVDLYRVALDGDITALAQLAPGAQVHVPLIAGAQVQVFGAVRRPGQIELLPGEHLDQALAKAGGLVAGADPGTLRMLREGSRGQEIIQLDATVLGSLVANSQDRLIVDFRRVVANGDGSVTVSGLVRTPGSHGWREGLTVTEVVTASGGLLPGADLSQMVIERTLATPRVIDLGGGIMGRIFQEMVAGAGPDTVLVPLDKVVIPQAPALAAQRAVITVQGAVLSPGTFPFNPALTFRDALKFAGGLLPEAQVDQADIVRVRIQATGQRDVERLPVELRPILDGQPGPTLANLDTIVIRTRADDRVRLTITGEVANVGSYILPRGTTLHQAIQVAGGLTTDAFPQGARFYRASEAREAQRNLEDMARQLTQAINVNQQQLASTTTPTGVATLTSTLAQQRSALVQMEKATATGRMAGINLPDILAGEAKADLVLQNGDALEVPSRPGTVRVLGEVMVPGSLRIEHGMRSSDVIQRSGGTTAQADLDRVFVVRADGSVVASAAFTGTAWNPEARRWVRTDIRRLDLMEGDSVIVPPDLTYHRDGLELALSWSEVLFRVAAAAGTIAVLAR